MPRVMQRRGVRSLVEGGGAYGVCWTSIVDTIRCEVIRDLDGLAGAVHVATTNFLRHLVRSFTAAARIALFHSVSSLYLFSLPLSFAPSDLTTSFHAAPQREILQRPRCD